jgi:MYXO-CTERM domain-containing protein
VTACPGTSGTVATATDCDDTRDDVNPAATERCDAANADEDCDGLADDADPSVAVSSFGTFYADADTDGFGDAAAQMSACEQPDGYVSDDTDCADEREDVHPGASEICDTEGVDEDCDGLVDDADPSVDASTTLTWYVDEDADGHGAFGSDVDACEAPDGHVAVDDDCDDTRSDVNPDVAEVPDDGVDQDCDGADATTGGGDGGSDGADGGSDGADGTDGADGGGDGSDGGGDGADGGSDGADGADGADGGGSGDVDDEEDDSKGGCACTSASTAPRAWLVGVLVVPALIISRRRRNGRG